MTRLAPLRSRLTALQAGRTTVRWGAALAAAIVAIVVGLLLVFALDVAFSLQVAQRVLVLVIAAGGVFWAIRKFCLPYLGVKEDLTQLALMVERQHHIDSDLVAALQFEGAGSSGTSARLGSLQLQSAVIEYVATRLPSIDIFRGFDRSELWRRAVLAILAVGAVIGVGAIFPQHFGVFLNRVLLGDQHYPTQTQVMEIQVNGQSVLTRAQWDDPLRPKDIACAQGEPVSFRIFVSGRVPETGIVKLVSQGKAAARTTLELTPAADVEDDSPTKTIAEAADVEPTTNAESTPTVAEDASPALAKTDSAAGTWFTAELGRLVDGVSYTLQIGDAFTDAAIIRLVPLPVIEPQLKTTPPSYAAGTQPPEEMTARQLAVLEGTKIELTVACTNQKRLDACNLQIKTKGGWQPVAMEPVDQAATVWQIAASTHPFKPVLEELQYELQVTDADGLKLEAPIRGQIRLRPDRPPVVSAGMVHRVVLPTAAPVIEYRATDDFGLSQLKVVVEVERAAEDGAVDETAATPAPESSTSVAPGERQFTAETAEVSLLANAAKVPGTQLPLAGKQSIDLSALKLAKPLEKGDRARLYVVAVDDRGEVPGKQSISEPLVLEISDESGVLSAISEADQQSEEQLNEIIRRQLGIGETR